MLQQPLLDCAICLETKEKKDFFLLKCCGNSLCNQCEPQLRETHSWPLPGHQDHRFIRCPLCRQMESVPFELATQLVSMNLRRNLQEFSLNMTPNFNLTPYEQAQRNAREIHQFSEIQQTRQLQETQERERRIQQERERLQRLEREEEENRYGANILAAMRLLDPRRLFQRRRQLVQGNDAWIEEEPVTPPGAPPGWIEPQHPNTRVPNNPIPRVPPPQLPQPTARLRESTPPPQINLIARRQLRTAAPFNQPHRSQLCSNNNCHHRTVFRCQTHPNVPCCRNCVCSQCQ